MLTIAYLSTMEYYFRPVELKWNKNVKTAISQIKEKNYPQALLDYTGDILLVGINYNKKTREHRCMIERLDCRNERTV